MSSLGLLGLTESDFTALRSQLMAPDCSFSVAQLTGKVPPDRFRFVLMALERSGLVHVRVERDQIILRAPYSPNRTPLIVERPRRYGLVRTERHDSGQRESA